MRLLVRTKRLGQSHLALVFGAMGPVRRRQQRGLHAAVWRMLLSAALAAAGWGLVVLPAPGPDRGAASVAPGSPQARTATGRELWRQGYSFALTLRGGGEKNKEASRKRGGEEGDEEGGWRDRKRARDEKQPRKHTAASEDRDQDEATSGSDSADELAYDEAAAGGEHGGRVGAHNLGTLPPPIPAPRAPLSKGAEGDDTTSESYPGCYSEVSSDVVEEPVEARSGPLPTREELIRQIRDRPFNSSLVSFSSQVFTSPHTHPTRACSQSRERGDCIAHSPARLGELPWSSARQSGQIRSTSSCAQQVDDWDRETDERMAADEAQAMRELKEEAELRKNGTYPGQANSRWVSDPVCANSFSPPPLCVSSVTRVFGL